MRIADEALITSFIDSISCSIRYSGTNNIEHVKSKGLTHTLYQGASIAVFAFKAGDIVPFGFIVYP